MKRLLLAAGLIALLGLMGACSKEAPEEAVDPMEQAWTDFRAAVGETDDSGEKVVMIEEFLAEYPEGEYAGMLAGAYAYYKGHDLGETEAALALLAETLDKNTDPEVRFQIASAMFPLSAELGEPMDLDVVAQELAATRPLTFPELIDIADMAVKHEQWEVGATYAEAALEMATPEAFLADYPDDDFTAEDAAAKAERRQVMGLANLGWALWNLEQPGEAMAAFERAMPLRSVNYVGAADTPLDYYHGKAKLAAGDSAAAMELLATSAIMSSDQDALAALREAYVATEGSDEDFDDWMWSQRVSLAKDVDTFTLADYEGNTHEFQDLADGNVTLLAFWFPT